MKELGYRREFILDPSLVLYLPLWKKDGASHVSRDTYGYVASRHGPYWTPNGHYFDGVDDYMIVPHHPLMNVPGNGFTIIAWVYPRSVVGHTSKLYTIVMKYGYPHGIRFGVYDKNVNMTTLTGSSWGASAFGDTDVPVNEWSHMVGKVDATHVYVYLNGVLDCAPVAWTTISNSTVNFTLGWPGGTTDYLWEGSMGEVAYYSRPLTQLEISNHYEATRWRYQ